MVNLLQLLEATCHVCLKVAMKTRFQNAAQPLDVAIGHPLTARVERLQTYLRPRVRMLKTPIPQHFDVRCAKRDLEDDRAPRVSVAINLALATLL